jgi:hypothetical protein
MAVASESLVASSFVGLSGKALVAAAAAGALGGARHTAEGAAALGGIAMPGAAAALAGRDGRREAAVLGRDDEGALGTIDAPEPRSACHAASLCARELLLSRGERLAEPAVSGRRESGRRACVPMGRARVCRRRTSGFMTARVTCTAELPDTYGMSIVGGASSLEPTARRRSLETESAPLAGNVLLPKDAVRGRRTGPKVAWR